MQIVKLTIISSGWPQLSNFWGLQFLHAFHFTLTVCGIFVSLLHLLASSCPSPPPPPHRDSSVKEVSCHQLGMWVLTVPDRNLFDVLPRLTFHQIPGLGVFFPSSQRPVR